MYVARPLGNLGNPQGFGIGIEASAGVSAGIGAKTTIGPVYMGAEAEAGIGPIQASDMTVSEILPRWGIRKSTAEEMAASAAKVIANIAERKKQDALAKRAKLLPVVGVVLLALVVGGYFWSQRQR